MSRHPEFGAGHPTEVEPIETADRTCDYCAKVQYVGLLRQVTIGRSTSWLCSSCFDRQREQYERMVAL